jgi:hypothetical protein
MGQHWTLTARCLVLDISVLLDSLSAAGVVMDCGVVMKAPFNTPVTEDTLVDIFKPGHAAFIATAINNHEALEQMVTRCLHHFERIRGDKEDTRIMVELRNALRRAKGRP